MRPMGRVSGAGLFRQQEIDGAAKQLCGGIAEHLFGDRVHQNNAALAIHFDDGVWRRFQKLAKPALRVHLAPRPRFAADQVSDLAFGLAFLAGIGKNKDRSLLPRRDADLKISDSLVASGY